MKHLWRALLLVLVLGVFMPSRSTAQGIPTQPGGGQGAGVQLGQNFPNPVTPSRLHRVGLRIYNLLAQLIAVPLLQGGGNDAGGAPLDGVQLTCNPQPYIGYWDGKNSVTGEDVASGVYLYRLEVDGKPLVKKLIVRK
jgi:hypothetical protein